MILCVCPSQGTGHIFCSNSSSPAHHCSSWQQLLGTAFHRHLYSNKDQTSGAMTEGFPGTPTASESGVSHGIACPQRLLLTPAHGPLASAELGPSPSSVRHTWSAPDCDSRPWGALRVPGLPRLGESFLWPPGITSSPSKNCIHPFERPQLRSPSPSSAIPSLRTFGSLPHSSQHLPWFSWVFISNEEDTAADIHSVFPILVS